MHYEPDDVEVSESVLVARNLQYPGPAQQRIVLDARDQSITFENCHWPRGFWTWRGEERRVCRFEDILAVHDFGLGKHRSVFISTRFGRCRVFADWAGYAPLREALSRITTVTERGSWQDDPRWMPVYVLVIGAIVAGILYLLL